MLSANKARAGKHGRGDAQVKTLSHDAVKLLKSQDAGYLRVVAGRGRREIRKLEEEVGMAIPQGKGRKIMFVDEDVGADRTEERAGRSGKVDSQLVADRRRDNDGSTCDTDNVSLVKDTATDARKAGVSAPITTMPKSKKALAAKHDTLRSLRAARKQRKRLAEVRITKLEALKKRQREIIAAADELDLQRAKMANAVGGVNKDGVRWKIRERKR